eukprot:1495026-Rhodomonas_salina.6
MIGASAHARGEAGACSKAWRARRGWKPRGLVGKGFSILYCRAEDAGGWYKVFVRRTIHAIQTPSLNFCLANYYPGTS